MNNPQNEQAGKPPRVRKLEFLINHYQEYQHRVRKQPEESTRYEVLITSLKKEYQILTGRAYEVRR